MAYATAADIETIYGRRILDIVADRSDTGRQDVDAVEAALQSSEDQINSYLGSRYTVPLDPVPPYIRQMCVDFTVYRLALDAAPRSDEMRLRYLDHIQYLKDVAAGKVDLPGMVTPGSGDSTGNDTLGPGAKILSARRG